MTYKSKVMKGLLARHGGSFSKENGRWYWTSADGKETKVLVTTAWASRKIKEEPAVVSKKKQYPPKKVEPVVTEEQPKVEETVEKQEEAPVVEKPKVPIFKTPIFKQVKPQDDQPTE
jgi:hypothetical protein